MATALKNDFVLQAQGFCTDYSLPVSSCPLIGLFFLCFLACSFTAIVIISLEQLANQINLWY